MRIDVVEADFSHPPHQQAIPQLLDSYARDPMGGGAPLATSVTEHLVAALAARPHAFAVLAYVDDHPAGLVIGFEGFSTFACRPLLNLHDVVVLPEFRGMGLCQRMLAQVEQIARARGCCKLTLEVLSNNTRAKAAYRTFGFADYQLDPDAGSARFWQKAL